LDVELFHVAFQKFHELHFQADFSQLVL